MNNSTTILKDSQLVQLAKQDRAQFKTLYDKYYQPIFCFVLNRCNDKATATDLCSEVFLKAMMQLERYEDRGFPFSSWLYKIAINACHDHFKDESKKRYVVIEGQMENELFAELSDQPHWLDDYRDHLAPALRQLSQNDLELIELRFFEKKSFREIGFYYDITANNAKVRTYRVIDKLKDIFRAITDEK